MCSEASKVSGAWGLAPYNALLLPQMPHTCGAFDWTLNLCFIHSYPPPPFPGLSLWPCLPSLTALSAATGSWGMGPCLPGLSRGKGTSGEMGNRGAIQPLAVICPRTSGPDWSTFSPPWLCLQRKWCQTPPRHTPISSCMRAANGATSAPCLRPALPAAGTGSWPTPVPWASRASPQESTTGKWA